METNSSRVTRLRSAPPTELEAHLGYWLRLVANHVSRQLARKMAALGTSESEWMVLRELYRPGPVTAIQLAAALGMTRGALSKLVASLCRKGLVETMPGISDRRTTCIELTSLGRVLTETLASMADATDMECFGHLPPSARLQMIAVLRHVARRQRLKP